MEEGKLYMFVNEARKEKPTSSNYQVTSGVKKCENNRNVGITNLVLKKKTYNLEYHQLKWFL